MPKLDKYHETVKRALIKDGWKIVFDPFLLKYKGLRLYIDLAAERILDDKKVAVEIRFLEMILLLMSLKKLSGNAVFTNLY